MKRMPVNEMLLNDLVRKRIKELRTEKGLTQEELAREVNLSRAAIANYESNNYPVDKLTVIYKICAALDVEINDILPPVSVILDKSSPDVVINQDQNLPDKVKAELKEFIEEA